MGWAKPNSGRVKDRQKDIKLCIQTLKNIKYKWSKVELQKRDADATGNEKSRQKEDNRAKPPPRL